MKSDEALALVDYVREPGANLRTLTVTSPDGCMTAIAARRGVVCGTGTATAEGAIRTIAVAEEERGCGVGRALVEALVDAARNNGLPVVTIRCEAAAAAGALGFYRRLGFIAPLDGGLLARLTEEEPR